MATQKLKHRSFTVEYKLEVVDWVEKNSSSLRAASFHFGLDRKVLRSWIKQKATLKRMQLSGGALNRKLHCGRCPVSEELDNKVLENVELVKRNSQRPINDQEVLQIAREVGKELGITNFKASGSWLRRWKCRCEAVKGEKEAEELSMVYNTELGVARCSEKSAHVNRTDTVCHQLTLLSDEDRKGSVQLDNCMKISGCESSDSVTVGPESCMECTADCSTPEHNYSMGLTHKASSTTSNCHSPNLKSNVAELLESVALLQAHEQGNLVGLEEESKENHMKLYNSCPSENSPRESLSGASRLSPDLSQSCFLDYDGLGNGLVDSHDYPCSNSPASLLEEEQFMSVFNQRSFTDPFPFLPPSYICFPPENLHSFAADGMCIDDLLHEAQVLDTASKRTRKKKSRSGKSTLGSDVGLQSFSSASSAGGRLAFDAHSPSLCSDHKTSPSSHSSVVTSPTYPNGLSSSPPGGLLANRRSQPVFPDEPEIVFHELQLGSLHTTPTQ